MKVREGISRLKIKEWKKRTLHKNSNMSFWWIHRRHYFLLQRYIRSTPFNSALLPVYRKPLPPSKFECMYQKSFCANLSKKIGESFCLTLLYEKTIVTRLTDSSCGLAQYDASKYQRKFKWNNTYFVINVMPFHH